jgi:hypothetical protein
MTDTLYDCDACGYFGPDHDESVRMLPEDTVTDLCPRCGSEDFGESPIPSDCTVFPTDTGWTWRVKPDDFHTAGAMLPNNYRIDSDGDLIGADVAGWTMDGYVLPRLASALVFPAWTKTTGVELVRVFGRRQWARGTGF